MKLIPAIDLKDGQVVRLLQGDFDKQTAYNDSPSDQANLFEDAGFEYLHIVDLDGAREGRPVNKRAVEEILDVTTLPLQLGGGIRDIQQIENWLDLGVNRVILGTIAIEKPELVRDAAKIFPGKIIVGLDARGEHIATDGWEIESSESLFDKAQFFEDCGVCAIIYTDIQRDGTQKGPNIKTTSRLASSLNIPVIASGGVGSIQDIESLREISSQGIEGVIVGKALYEGKISPQQALEAARRAS